LENELTSTIDFLKDGVSSDVAGKKVGSELDALVFEFKKLGKSLDELGFSKARQTFQKDVTAGKDAGNNEADNFFLTEENLIQPFFKGTKVFGCIGDFGFSGIIHMRIIQDQVRMASTEVRSL
jgi:hypothetical protein